MRLRHCYSDFFYANQTFHSFHSFKAIKMKRHIAILLSCFYLLFSTGLVVNVHFCGDKFSGISFFKSGKGCCCGKEMKKKNCCKEEISTLKISDTHQSSENLRISSLKLSASIIGIFVPNVLLMNTLTEEQTLIFADSSPPPNSIPLFLRNCVFLI